MIRVRPAAERGGGDYGWLDTSHTFSFDDVPRPASTWGSARSG